MVWEEHVGLASERVCYPNITRCLTVTGNCGNFLHAAHIPTLSEDEHVERLLSALDAGQCHEFFVAGPIPVFKEDFPGQQFDSRFKMSSALRKLAPNAKVKFLDTTKYGEVNIHVERQGEKMSLFLAPSKLEANIPRNLQIPENPVKIVVDADEFKTRNHRFKLF